MPEGKYWCHPIPSNIESVLTPAPLVNEAFIRLTEGKKVDWQNRSHFFAVAARVLRRIAIDHAKTKNASKRGGKAIKVEFNEILHHGHKSEEVDLLKLDEALDKLKKMDERLSEVVELRYFGGLSLEETAEILGISIATVKRDWATAKLWLYREIQQKD